MLEKSIYKVILFGGAIGVPVEFKSREEISENPATESQKVNIYIV